MAIYLPSRNQIVYCIPKCGSHYLWEVCRTIDRTAYRIMVSGITEMHPTPQQVWGRADIVQKQRPRGIVFTRPPKEWTESFWRFQQSVGWKFWEPDSVHPTRCLRACRDDDLGLFKRKCDLMFPDFVNKLFASYQHHSVRVAKLSEVTEELRVFLGVDSLPVIPHDKWNKSQ